MSFHNIVSQPFNVLWRTALVRLPRAVPTQILRFTDSEGPQPIIVELPSRGDYKIPVYIWIPKDINASNSERRPVVIDFHGGGFFLGSCLEQAPFCSKMARELGAIVLSVDYRMGPLSKFPAAVEDAEDVLKAVLEPGSPAGALLRDAVRDKIGSNWNESRKERSEPAQTRPDMYNFDLDTRRIAISGFSSGGNLALNLGLSLTEPEPEWPSFFPPDYAYPIPLLLYYPSFDSRQLPSERTKPPKLPVSRPFWAEVSDMLAPTYLPREMAGHPRASPGLANVQGLHRMARCLLVLPELDTLAEQSETWVKAMETGGRADDLVVERFPGVTHGWTQMPDGWLGEAEKRSKTEIFDKTVAFTRSIWDINESAVKA
jgi:acetyl esterase/lipase